MAASYVVQAQIVDLMRDAPRVGDKFFVDSNAWFWTVYSSACYSSQPPKHYQTLEYPRYLKRALTSGAELRWCGLSLSELAHRIESTEFDIYCQTAAQSLKSKEYRHNLPAERLRVAQEIQTAWHAVQSMGQCVEQPPLVDANATATALAELSATALDAYDVFALQACRASGITQIISDDGDFCLVAGIMLFTANGNVLSQARAQRKLVVR